MTITPGAEVRQAPGRVSAPLGDETAILDIERGAYYHLDPVGAYVWALLAEPRRVTDVRDAVVAEFDVEPEPCEQDLLALLADLCAHGLIQAR